MDVLGAGDPDVAVITAADIEREKPAEVIEILRSLRGELTLRY